MPIQTCHPHTPLSYLAMSAGAVTTSPTSKRARAEDGAAAWPVVGVSFEHLYDEAQEIGASPLIKVLAAADGTPFQVRRCAWLHTVRRVWADDRRPASLGGRSARGAQGVHGAGVPPGVQHG